MESKVLILEDASRQSSHSPSQVDKANGSVDVWLGAVPVSNRSQYAVIYAVIVSVQRFDGSNNSLISAAGADMYAEVADSDGVCKG